MKTKSLLNEMGGCGNMMRRGMGMPQQTAIRVATPNELTSFLQYASQAENEEEEMDSSAMVDFFKRNANPSDEEVQALAKDMGIDPDTFEKQVYAMLHKMLQDEDSTDEPSEEENSY